MELLAQIALLKVFVSLSSYNKHFPVFIVLNEVNAQGYVTPPPRNGNNGNSGNNGNTGNGRIGDVPAPGTIPPLGCQNIECAPNFVCVTRTCTGSDCMADTVNLCVPGDSRKYGKIH
ncbi:hypothetical protein OESDEN_10234 [Oesophagostomum dentatum]|uniref:Uncharacterized protein n=1 Tax=Oesophagostomum dentatum TaxID=61180 RepID=A0A0B1T197_OESDE|nr:hypothetical protein OESDEN_10234 [Oesophagostomum dentatum]